MRRLSRGCGLKRANRRLVIGVPSSPPIGGYNELLLVEGQSNALSKGTLNQTPDSSLSRTNINGAVQMASILGAAFAVEWRFADNSVISLDAAGMIAMGIAVGQHVADCQYRKNELDAEIEAAATQAELDAIAITGGWPG